MNTAAFFVAGIITLISVLVWIALLVWGAIEDGREQQRHENSHASGAVAAGPARGEGGGRADTVRCSETRKSRLGERSLTRYCHLDVSLRSGGESAI